MTELQIPSSSQAQQVEPYVAPLLPPTASPPEPLRKRFFLTDLLLYWLVPHKRGPHLCVRSIWRAWAAAVIALFLSFGIITTLTLIDYYHDELNASSISVTSFNDFRMMAAEMIMDSANESQFGRIPTERFLILIFIPAWLIITPAIGTITMPFAASGDRPWSVWKRSVKNAFWSTTILLPACLTIPLASLLSQFALEQYRPLPEWQQILLDLAVPGLSLFWFVFWIRAIIVGAGKYVGEPDGPAWSEREPLCDDCGYRLTHLPLDSRCPECGLPVHISLPGGRRQPTLWSLNERNRWGFFELLKMQWRIIRQPDYFKHIPVQNMLGPARHFWWATYLVMVLGMLLIGLVFTGILSGYVSIIRGHVLSDDPEKWILPFVFSAMLIPIPFLLTILTNFPACLWAKWKHGIYDYRVSATACFYSIPALWLVYVSLLVFVSVYQQFLMTTHKGMYFVRTEFMIPALITWCMGLAVLYSFYNWLSGLNRALSDVRFANE